MVVYAPLLLLCILLSESTGVFGQLIESERLEEYHKRGYTWPPHEYVPNTEGWKRLMGRRFDQVIHVEDTGKKYDGWVETVTAAYSLANFTETGWGLTRAPQELVDTLRQAIRDGLPSAKPEGDVDVIEKTPLFIKRPDLTNKVLHGLRDIHEAWSGEALVPHQSYGFRLYQNESRLHMHIDRTSTHIISSILHIDSSDDAQPWPIIIEDFQGNTNEVILTPGDMLLYESGKCFHGRPTKFNGSWYTSVFTHYYPDSEEWKSVNHELEGHYGIPPHWNSKPAWDPKYPKLKIIGTSMHEPECEGNWCLLEDSVKWEGPGEYGQVLTTGQHRYPLFPDDDEKEEL
eukprot:CAMPEP_0195310056 /NCGR_PEP_ID=MMETSP0707-20130614/39054_1 /TAXON_ID=33640 /ORGANISM="Asterionellopsis glacialis, Strain CCMP134" /LENGTH=343 /DNA_ID=CAMNT_0040374365 /DNA_START=44 /DNA_END=1075 /DNA_ORIENTATION=-